MIYVISKKDIQGDSGLTIRNLFDTYGNKIGTPGFTFDRFEYEYAGITSAQNLEPYKHREVQGSNDITISSPECITNLLKQLLNISHVDNDKMWCIDIMEYSSLAFQSKLELFKKEILRIDPKFKFTKQFIGIDLLGKPFGKNSKFGKEINIHSAIDRLQGSYSFQGQDTKPNVTGIDFASQLSNDSCATTIVSNTPIVENECVSTPSSDNAPEVVNTKKKSRYKFYNLF